MRNIVKFITVTAATIALIGCVTACGSQETGGKNIESKENTTSTNDINSTSTSDQAASNSESNFEWDGNIIIALSDQGAKQKSLIIPSRCEGFRGLIFTDKENVVEEVSFESDKEVEFNGVFHSLTNIKKVTLPSQLTVIRDLEFWISSSLQSIHIPAGVTSIGSCAFQNNTALETVSFEGNNTVTIMYKAFDGCISLSDVQLSDSIVTIEEYAFYGCTSLKSIRLPESVQEIGAFAFANNGLTEVYIPAAVELKSYDETSFGQVDRVIDVYVVEGSWMDQNFEAVFVGAYGKKYYDGQ